MIVSLGGTSMTVPLLTRAAPQNSALLSRIARTGRCFEARHAVHSGPEISCPIDAGRLPFPLDPARVPLENPSHMPRGGEVVVVCAGTGRWGSVPTHPLIDIGIFYEDGGRLSFPFGDIEGSVAAQCEDPDLPFLQACGRHLRNGEAIALRLELPG
jgi:hypothetical protein